MYEGKFGFLSGNLLKIIACIFMTIDHVGYFLFPRLTFLRILGRLSFPIFAFFIAEGCKYTKNRILHLILIVVMGVIFQFVTYFYAGITSLNIFFTLSVSVILIYLLDYLKTSVFINKNVLKIIISSVLFALSIFIVYVLNLRLNFDYGFYGCLAPVFVGLFDFRISFDDVKIKQNTVYRIISSNFFRLIYLALALILIWQFSVNSSIKQIQWYSLFSLIPLLLYNGKRGVYNRKYFFYLYYRIHILIIVLVSTYLV